jgi:glutamate synthase (NADPH/NADH) small chain
MEPEPPSNLNWKAKHAWMQVGRADPPKRRAESRVADFHEIYSLYEEAIIKQQASRCIQCPEAS